MVAAGIAISAVILRRSSDRGWQARNMIMAEPLGRDDTRKAFNWITGARRSADRLKEAIDPASYGVIGRYADDGLDAAKLAVAAALTRPAPRRCSNACQPESEKEHIMSASAHTRRDPASEASPLAVMQAILSNPTDLDFVRQYTTDDFTYVSLNYGSPEVKQVLPWAGTTEDTRGLVQAFVDVNRYWKVDEFEIQDSFENEDGAAIFGTFTYTSNTLGKTVTSPFAVLARGRDGKLSYVQFMEDTFATVRSFRESGAYRIKADPDGSQTDI